MFDRLEKLVSYHENDGETGFLFTLGCLTRIWDGAMLISELLQVQ